MKSFLIFFKFPVDKLFFICYYNLNKNKYKYYRKGGRTTEELK